MLLIQADIAVPVLFPQGQCILVIFEYAGAFGENKMEGKNKKIKQINRILKIMI